MSDREAQRAARRAAMPTVSAIVAELEQFKPQVVYAQENGITVGKAPKYAEVFDIPANYFPCAEYTTKGRK